MCDTTKVMHMNEILEKVFPKELVEKSLSFLNVYELVFNDCFTYTPIDEEFEKIALKRNSIKIFIGYFFDIDKAKEYRNKHPDRNGVYDIYEVSDYYRRRSTTMPRRPRTVI